MEVLNERTNFLSNFEVFELLKQEKKKFDVEKLNHGKFGNYRQTILTEQAIKYFEELPFSKLSNLKFKKILLKLKSYELVKIEKLQILNILPNSAPLYSPIIENLMERFKVLAFEEEEAEGAGDNFIDEDDKPKKPVLEDLIEEIDAILNGPEDADAMLF